MPAERGCVRRFITPVGNLQTHVVEVPEETAVDIRCEEWFARATFSRGVGACSCECCEYRQYVKAGPIWIVPPAGDPWSWNAPTHWVIAFEHPYWRFGYAHRWDNWTEDTLPDRHRPGQLWRYGYRGDDRWRPPGA